MSKIQNEKQLSITRNWIARFQASLDGLVVPPEGTSDLRYRAHRDSLHNQVEVLKQEVDEYERTVSR